ncbi:lysophospholipid acyltransferase family protein [Rhizobiales bacterium]|uniref:lysophospholipid acyltransferase family protein n=1 Tax=Hongsoonwoonella zoysiae TaxID=2821844 RepID=UPI00155FFC09|nr:lysophospholipid acyltransferase family protein [Hongsoonwoonella zoysiae]NRG18377.1 lysophospholipid acyltransferase family protein [Hongsoonwoonella zoysiae]
MKRIFSARDAALMIGLPLLLPAAWTWPRRAWPRLAHALEGSARRFVSNNRTDRIPTRMAEILPDIDGPGAADAILTELAGEQLVMLMEMLRYHRPGRWDPIIEIEGRERVAQALDNGRGAIFWISPFVHMDIIAKVALKRCGVEFVHLMRATHGLSETAFGEAVLNRVMRKPEEAFTLRREVIDPKNAGLAALHLTRALKNGGNVWITAARSMHRNRAKPLRVPFLNGKFNFAPGAAALALRTEANLLPVVTLRERKGTYRVVVGPNLNDPATYKDGEPTPRRIVHRYAKFVSGYVAEYPEQWRGWFQL